MKKLVCLFLVCVLLSAIPMNVFATEEIFTKASHTAKACEVFPEFADKISGSFSSRTRSSTSAPEVVYSECRQVSDVHTMTYIEFDDGSAAVASLLSDPYKTINITNSSTGAGATSFTATLYCSHSESDDELYVRNVRFTTISNSFDCINSAGSTSGSTANVLTAGIYRQYETNADPAEARYGADFSRDGTVPLEISLKLRVKNNTYWVD